MGATKREIAPPPKIYGLNKERLEEVKMFLREVEGKDELV